MYFVRTPYIIKKLFPEIIWDLPNNENKVFLTFDDGPHPEITPWILEQLRKYDAKATFFCLGENVNKYSEIAQQIVNEGHQIGNHGYAHLDGWKTNDNNYKQDYLKGKEILKQVQHHSILFRPAYGKLTLKQYHTIKKDYKIINWSLMAGDFDQSISSAQCYSNLQRFRSGDIIVMHDNDKSWKHLKYCLPKFLEYCREKNFSLDKLNL